LVEGIEVFSSPCPKGVIIQCSIKRDKSSIAKRFYP